MDNLSASALCKKFKSGNEELSVLKDLNLTVNKGEMVGIMGPSGSGKSTLLYLLSGLDKITSGSVDYFGNKIENMSEKELSLLRLKEMGFVFQQMYMLDDLNIFDNIILPGIQAKDGADEIGQRSKEEIIEKAKELAKTLSIEKITDNPVNKVSGGQLQRACICRSLINDPKVLFADEPTGALNKQNSIQVMDELNSLNKKGMTIILVTHDLLSAVRCERILYIDDGHITDECKLGKYDPAIKEERLTQLNNWLTNQGW